MVPGVNDAKSLDAIGQVLAGTDTLLVGTGIASIWHWDPADLAARADHLAATYGDRFILGLGNSHAPLLESEGREYVKPYSKTVEFVDHLPRTRAPLILAALGPKMLELSRTAPSARTRTSARRSTRRSPARSSAASRC